MKDAFQRTVCQTDCGAGLLTLAVLTFIMSAAETAALGAIAFWYVPGLIVRPTLPRAAELKMLYGFGLPSSRSLEELTGLCQGAGLGDLKTAFFKLDVALEALLAASFPNPGDGDRIRQTFAADIGVDRLGVSAHRRDGAIHFAFPIVVIAGLKRAGG